MENSESEALRFERVKDSLDSLKDCATTLTYDASGTLLSPRSLAPAACYQVSKQPANFFKTTAGQAPYITYEYDSTGKLIAQSDDLPATST